MRRLERNVLVLVAAAGCLGSGGVRSAWGDDRAGEPASETPEAETPKARSRANLEREPVAGDDVKVIFTSRDSAEGRVEAVEDDGYRIVIGGLSVFVASRDLMDIIVLPSVEERFAQMRALMDPADAKSMVALGNWAYERDLFERALEVVDAGLERSPRDADLRVLRGMVVAQLEMRKRPAREADVAPAEEEGDNGAVQIPRPWPDFPLLTDEQVGLIKVYEVDLRRPPRIVIERETVDALLQRYADNPVIPSTREGREAFRRRSAAQILEAMFRVRARELYADVRVVGHPQSMRTFRDHIHAGWLVNSCATNRCHGGEGAPRPVLFNRRPTAARSVYTNFLILERYESGRGERMIDYQTPERSLLVQMGLPRDEAVVPHPDVPGWSPVFRSRQSRGLVRTLGWIDSMYRPRPRHPIEYTPPGSVSEETGEGEPGVER